MVNSGENFDDYDDLEDITIRVVKNYDPERSYTRVPNKAFEELTYLAVGLYMRMIVDPFKPVSPELFAENPSAESLPEIEEAFQELKELGYLQETEDGKTYPVMFI